MPTKPKKKPKKQKINSKYSHSVEPLVYPSRFLNAVTCRTFELPIGNIVVTIDKEGHGKITSNLLEGNKVDYDDEDEADPDDVMDRRCLEAAINAIESLILGHAVAGIDIESAGYINGLEDTINAIGNHLL